MSDEPAKWLPDPNPLAPQRWEKEINLDEDTGVLSWHTLKPGVGPGGVPGCLVQMTTMEQLMIEAGYTQVPYREGDPA